MADYEPLTTMYDKEEEGSESSLLIDSRTVHKKPLRTWLWTWSWTFHLFFISTYVAIFSSSITDWPVQTLLGLERIYDDAPGGIETVVFQQSGFHGPSHQNRTPYEGIPNEHNTAAWDHLMKGVGIIGISEVEADRLPGMGTIRSVANPDAFIVQLEMFHQLHCLKQLRMQLWEFEEGAADPNQAEQRQQHWDHCIDYLRQAVMCHGDLTPVTFEWNNEFDVYLAHHRTVHQCRNFDAIYEWAEVRNTVGLATDGMHKNNDGAAKYDNGLDPITR